MDEDEQKLMHDRTKGHNGSGSGSGGDNGDVDHAEDDDDISVTSTSCEGAVNVILDTVLQAALEKVGVVGRMNQLNPSQQRIAAEKIAKAKEKLSEKLSEQLRNDVNGDGGGVGGVPVGAAGGVDNGQGVRSGSGSDMNSNALVITKEHVKRCMEEMQKDL